jgi:hypothetical protein
MRSPKAMCMLYYLGTDADVALSPAWREEAPAFYVSRPSDDELAKLRGKLPHKYIIHLGSHEGCGCGFRRLYDGVSVPQDEEEEKRTRADHMGLVAFLSALPTSTRANQIFGCWSGDEAEPARFFRDCGPADFGADDFAFQERELITLR